MYSIATREYALKALLYMYIHRNTNLLCGLFIYSVYLQKSGLNGMV